jgi:hypothetical protein
MSMPNETDYNQMRNGGKFDSISQPLDMSYIFI